MSTTATAPAVVLSADDATAAALVSTIRSAVAGVGKYAAYVAAHDVTRETVKDHAFALAVLAYPNDDTVQSSRTDDGRKVRTRFGNAVQAAGNGLRNALDSGDTADDDRPVNLLTRAGLAAPLDDVIAAWTAAQG